MASAYGATVKDLPTPVLVAIGGIAGAAVRWATGELFGASASEPVGATLVVNVVGALLLGAVLAQVARGLSPSVIALVGVGFCGAMTTMSTLALQTAVRIDDGRWADGIGLLALHVGLGLVAAVVGARAVTS